MDSTNAEARISVYANPNTVEALKKNVPSGYEVKSIVDLQQTPASSLARKSVIIIIDNAIHKDLIGDKTDDYLLNLKNLFCEFEGGMNGQFLQFFGVGLAADLLKGNIEILRVYAGFPCIHLPNVIVSNSNLQGASQWWSILSKHGSVLLARQGEGASYPAAFYLFRVGECAAVNQFAHPAPSTIQTVMHDYQWVRTPRRLFESIAQKFESNPGSNPIVSLNPHKWICRPGDNESVKRSFLRREDRNSDCPGYLRVILGELGVALDLGGDFQDVFFPSIRFAYLASGILGIIEAGHSGQEKFVKLKLESCERDLKTGVLVFTLESSNAIPPNGNGQLFGFINCFRDAVSFGDFKTRLAGQLMGGTPSQAMCSSNGAKPFKVEILKNKLEIQVNE